MSEIQAAERYARRAVQKGTVRIRRSRFVRGILTARFIVMACGAALAVDGVSDVGVDVIGDANEIGIPLNAASLEDKDSGIETVGKFLGAGTLLLLGGGVRNRAQWLQEGQLLVPVDCEFSPDQIAEAFRQETDLVEDLIAKLIDEGGGGDGLSLRSIGFNRVDETVQWRANYESETPFGDDLWRWVSF